MRPTDRSPLVRACGVTPGSRGLSRGDRWLAAGLVAALLITLLPAVLPKGLVAPASAATLRTLSVSPERDLRATGAPETLVATIGGTGSGTGVVNVVFEVESGPNAADPADATRKRRLTCTVPQGGTTCNTDPYLGNGGAGTDVVRAWIDDPADPSAGHDTAEGRDERVEPGTLAEPDNTDVVSVTWAATVAAVASLDCNPEGGTRPAAGTDSTQAVSCTARADGGAPVAGVPVDAEILGGPNDPDSSSGAGTADFDDLCVTGSDGTCAGTIPAGRSEAGTATVCFWADYPSSDGAFVPAASSGAPADGGGCTGELVGDPEGDDVTDAVSVTWRATDLLSLSPTAASSPIGLAHVVTANLRTDQHAPVTGVRVRFSVTGANTASGSSVTDSGGNATFAYSGGPTVGTDKITAFVDLDGDGVRGASEPMATVSKAWTSQLAGLLECVPKTSLRPSTGAASTGMFTCTVKDSAGNPVLGARIDGENLGPANDPDASDSSNGTADYDNVCTTGATGSCDAPIPSLRGEAGQAAICLWVDGNDDATYAESASAQDGGQCRVDVQPAPGGDVTVIVSQVWTAPIPWTLSVSPLTTTVPVGTPFKVTTTVLDQFGDPLPGVPIRFSVAGATAPAMAVGTTGTAGALSFTYTGATAGGDVVSVFDDLNRNGVKDQGELLSQATAVWTASGTPPPPPPSGSLGGQGYWLVATDGGIFAFGGAQFKGSTGAIRLNRPIVGMAPTPTGQGYWLVASDGGIFAFGDATFKGSTGNVKLNRPIVGMAPTPTGKGYWLVATDGGIFAFGDAAFKGSTGNIKLNQPIVGMAPTASGQGYWMTASDGGIFAFGDAAFKGSTGAIRLNRPIVGVAPTPTGQGYWLVASDGGIFAFGDAEFKGSTGALSPGKPVIGISATSSGQGYRLVTSDGGVFTFGDAEFKGSTSSVSLTAAIVGIARTSG